ncbi:ankyrin repeat and LEM domain-containing protein 1 isoform X2 [Heliangelus exortis]|uniref:ankyrin repeat and LEM domain-containing protein 1 isoform X2 n=1 Tax=Heliangelus exortis TaxID=472823 RepID=UPI003A8DE6B1
MAGHSPELVAALRTGHIPDCARDELALIQQFEHPDRNRRWREGVVKSSFNYLLLDPRTTQNLPLRSNHLSPVECFRTFVEAIFYVGKGDTEPALLSPQRGAGTAAGGEAEGLPQGPGASWRSGRAGRASSRCSASRAASRPRRTHGRGCLVEALDPDQPAERTLLWGGSQLASPETPPAGGPHVVPGHEHLPG